MITIELFHTECNWGNTACPELKKPANGAVYLSRLEPQAQARYSCDFGYRLSRNEIRTCHETSRMWTGEAPVCVTLTTVPTISTTQTTAAPSTSLTLSTAQSTGSSDSSSDAATGERTLYKNQYTMKRVIAYSTLKNIRSFFLHTFSTKQLFIFMYNFYTVSLFPNCHSFIPCSFVL